MSRPQRFKTGAVQHFDVRGNTQKYLMGREHAGKGPRHRRRRAEDPRVPDPAWCHRKRPPAAAYPPPTASTLSAEHCALLRGVSSSTVTCQTVGSFNLQNTRTKRSTRFGVDVILRTRNQHFVRAAVCFCHLIGRELHRVHEGCRCRV